MQARKGNAVVHVGLWNNTFLGLGQHEMCDVLVWKLPCRGSTISRFRFLWYWYVLHIILPLDSGVQTHAKHGSQMEQIECSMICLWPWLDHRELPWLPPKRQRWDWSGRQDRGCPVRTSANPRIRECAGLELTGMRCQATLRIKKGHDVAAIVSPFPQLSSASSLDFRESHDSNSSPISLCFLVFLGDTGLLGAESAYW